jgi:hypothetical protein
VDRLIELYPDPDQQAAIYFVYTTLPPDQKEAVLAVSSNDVLFRGVLERLLKEANEDGAAHVQSE